MTTGETMVIVGATLFTASVALLLVVLARALRRVVAEPPQAVPEVQVQHLRPPARSGPYVDDDPTRPFRPIYDGRHRAPEGSSA